MVTNAKNYFFWNKQFEINKAKVPRPWEERGMSKLSSKVKAYATKGIPRNLFRTWRGWGLNIGGCIIWKK